MDPGQFGNKREDKECFAGLCLRRLLLAIFAAYILLVGI